MNPPNLNYLWTHLLIEELSRLGIEYVCLSPGSRSAPLAIAAALQPKIKTLIHYDERGMAFNALGYVSATGKPAVIITTSGSALGNIFPAVIEASKKKLPLIILSGDRPPELRKTGAEQTIDQPGIFGEYVRWEMDFPCPTIDIQPQFILTTIDQAEYKSRHPMAGPVHINCMFREPLAPIETKHNFAEYLKPLNAWQKSTKPFTKYTASQKELSAEHLKETATALNKIKNGWIVVGKVEREALPEILQLSERLGWPVLPDISSGLRLGTRHPNVIPYFDQILLDENKYKQLKVDGVLHLGGRITSKRWYQFIEHKKPEQYIMVLNHSLRNDPLHNVSTRLETKVSSFCEGILPFLEIRKDKSQTTKLKKQSDQIHKQLDVLSKENTINEPQIARSVSKLIPKNSGLFLASSMSIRDMDMFADAEASTVHMGANRGANGIDGLIASSVGFSFGLEKPVTLMIGDLAFLYDLNSLIMLKNSAKPIVVIVMNNDGGAMFSFLPIAQFPQTFEKLFGTPHGLTFKSAAELFSLNYSCPKTLKEFETFYQKALTQKTSSIIEIQTKRTENFTLHKTLQEKIKV